MLEYEEDELATTLTMKNGCSGPKNWKKGLNRKKFRKQGEISSGVGLGSLWEPHGWVRYWQVENLSKAMHLLLLAFYDKYQRTLLRGLVVRAHSSWTHATCVVNWGIIGRHPHCCWELPSQRICNSLVWSCAYHLLKYAGKVFAQVILLHAYCFISDKFDICMCSSIVC